MTRKTTSAKRPAKGTRQSASASAGPPEEEATISREFFDKAMSAILAVPWDVGKWKADRQKKKRRKGLATD